jgi:hypothetical protein
MITIKADGSFEIAPIDQSEHEFPNSPLADLYDALTMPPALVKAHNELD